MSSGCCRAAHGADALISAARCLYPAGPANCTHEATSQATTKALWLDCGSLRGLFLVSHDKDGNMVCTEGDVYRVWAVESRTRYSTYTIGIGGMVWPSLYFANLTGGMLMGSRRKYRVSASLLETQNRSLQLAEHHPGLHFSASTASPTRDWFRYRLCVGRGVSLSSKSHDGSMTVETHNEPQSTGAVKAHEPRCRALPPSSSSVIVALDDSNRSHHPFACGHLCMGNASARVLRPFRGPKDADRAHLGFRHVLKPEGCRYHWFDENELGRCLAGREVLNIGGSVANSLQRGFERISSVAANKMNWWWNYGRTGINNNHDEATGKSRFNGSTVTTQFIHHPFRYGLANVIRPNPKLVVGPKSKAAYETLMCKHDLVIFESGVHGRPSSLFSTPHRWTGVPSALLAPARACSRLLSRFPRLLSRFPRSPLATTAVSSPQISPPSIAESIARCSTCARLLSLPALTRSLCRSCTMRAGASTCLLPTARTSRS